MKRRRRSLRISQDLETCGETFGSVWKEPSPESCRQADLKEKRRRSKILNAEELLPFKVTETQYRAEVEHLDFLNVDIQTTPLSEVERARCPDKSIGDEDNPGITPINITEDVLNPSTEKISFIDDTPRSSSTSTPLPKLHPEVFSTPLAPPHLSDSLPYSPSQPILGNISESLGSSSLVSPCSPASDVEFFTPMSHMKSHPSQTDLSSRKASGTKFRPKQLAAEYSVEKMSGKKNEYRQGDSAANFANVCKSLGEKLLMLKKTSSSEENTTQSLTGIVEEDVGFERKEENSKIDQSIKNSASPDITETHLKFTESPQKTMDSCVMSQSCDKLKLQTEQNEEPSEHLLENCDKSDEKNIQTAEMSNLDVKPCLTPDLHGLPKAYSASPQHSQDQISQMEEKIKTSHNKAENVEMQEKTQPRKRGRPRKSSTGLPTSGGLKQVVCEISEEKINNLVNMTSTKGNSNEASAVNLLNLENVHGCNEMQNENMSNNFVDQSQGNELDKEKIVSNESEMTTDDAVLRYGKFSTVLKRSRGRPRKKSLDSKSEDIGGNSENNRECDVKKCEGDQEQEELLAREKKLRKMRRRSLNVFKGSVEMPCSTELREDSVAENDRDFSDRQLQHEPKVEEKTQSESQRKALENFKDSVEESCIADVEDSQTETGNIECQNNHQKEGLKRKEKKPKKSLETLKDSTEEPCKGDLEDDSMKENGDVEFHQQEELLVAERKSRRLRRRSFEIYKAYKEESSEIELKEPSTEETKVFGNVLKDLNGTTAPTKAPRKRKKCDSEEDIVKIYTSKNYIPPAVKALETISESPTIAKQARKLKRMIEFGSLYHVPPIKQKKRQQKAVKRGWDQRKLRKNKMSDDIAQQKLQSIWDDLDKD
ncbi:axoneme-associated protein mst101(2)-like [Saccostrea cucullata]|uniref:axoneme-associated protein mst101(2)-like n=1 Tax=Saccostrea cuccullata TaxID=36930 RepID=UPI002ED52870